MPARLNARQEKFARNISKGMTQYDAYRKAGYKASRPETGWAAASRLARNVKVADRILEIFSKSETDLIIDRNTMTNAYTLTVQEARNSGNLNAVKGALDSLAKLHGLMIDRKETGRPGDFGSMADDQLREFIQTAANQLSSDGGGEAGTEEEGEEEEG